MLFFHYIDAKQAQKEHTDELDDLITCLKSYATQDGKICMVRGKLIRVLKYVGLYLHDFKKCQDPAALFETTRIKVVHRLLREFGDTQALETFENLWRTSK